MFAIGDYAEADYAARCSGDTRRVRVVLTPVLTSAREHPQEPARLQGVPAGVRIPPGALRRLDAGYVGASLSPE